MAKNKILLLILLLGSLGGCWAEARTVQVFVALCDNASQGIVPVPARIGDGNQPQENLYWGCSDGLRSVFLRSRSWKLLREEKNVSAEIMERLTFSHVSSGVLLTASAYRGSAMRQCLQDFESCAAAGQTDLTVYIGHNGLMDFSLPPVKARTSQSGDAMVLCCKSNAYFAARLRALNVRPVLLTDQLMYPGAFIVRDTVEIWQTGGSLTAIRQAAGKAYAANQKISQTAAVRVFTKLD